MINRRQYRLALHRVSANGFTLVELLVAIAIVGLLTSIALVGMAGVTENARGDRTRAQVARIHSLIAPKWEELHERRIKMPTVNTSLGVDFRAAGGGRQMAFVRLNAKRELLRMSLPERRSDLLDRPIILSAPPTEWRSYRRAAVNAIAKKRGGSFRNWTDDNAVTNYLRTNWDTRFQTAECLYLILSKTVDGDRAALEFFRDDEIGDVDEDGLLEVHDGWGNPITFLRWAPGFTGIGTFQSLDLPDPLDPLDLVSNRRNDNPLNPVDQLDNTFQLFPVIVSSGPDKISDLVTEFSASSAIRYSLNGNDPYLRADQSLALHDPAQLLVGATYDVNGDGKDNSADNIHNHLISAGR